MYTFMYLSCIVAQLGIAWSITAANVHMVDVCFLGVSKLIGGADVIVNENIFQSSHLHNINHLFNIFQPSPYNISSVELA